MTGRRERRPRQGGPESEAGVGAAAGVNVISKDTRAFIGASYQLNEHYNLDFYVFTLQSPMMRQGDKWVPRFPIGSITDSASNNTSLIVSLGAAY